VANAVAAKVGTREEVAHALAAVVGTPDAVANAVVAKLRKTALVGGVGVMAVVGSVVSLPSCVTWRGTSISNDTAHASVVEEAARGGASSAPDWMRDTQLVQGWPSRKPRFIPPQPLPGQGVGKCGEMDELINGGCWLKTQPVPCNLNVEFEYNGGCYRPVAPNPAVPATVDP